MRVEPRTSKPSNLPPPEPQPVLVTAPVHVVSDASQWKFRATGCVAITFDGETQFYDVELNAQDNATKAEIETLTCGILQARKDHPGRPIVAHTDLRDLPPLLKQKVYRKQSALGRLSCHLRKIPGLTVVYDTVRRPEYQACHDRASITRKQLS